MNANRNKITYIIAAVLVLAGVIFLVITSGKGSVRYFVTVEELLAMKENGFGKNLTISGAILGDSIKYNSSLPQLTFTIVQVPGDPKEVEDAGGLATVLQNAVMDTSLPRISIVYNDVKPDLLENMTQAIIRGKLGSDGIFYADELLLKCPSRYEEANSTPGGQ